MATKQNVETAPKKIIECVSYARVSDMGQTEDNSGLRLEDGSPDAQRKKCADYLAQLSKKTGFEYHLFEHINDEGFTGTNTKRPGYQRLWQLISTGRIRVLVASELSRLSRSVVDFLALITHCEKHNVQAHIIGMDLDTSSPFGRVLVVILVALAQFEAEMTRKRVKENTLLRLLNDGRINGAGEILGLLKDSARKGHFVKDEAGLASAEKILRLFVKLSSKKKVLQAARDLGLTGPRGKALTLQVIESTLNNVNWRYQGLWCANPENRGKAQELLPAPLQYQVVKLPHGPLLNKNLLDEVASKMKDTHANKKCSGKDDYVYLLSHILYFEDRTRFTGQPGKDRQYRYYHNRNHDIRIRCDHLDPIIGERIKASFHDNKRFLELLGSAIKTRQENLPKLDVELSRVRRELRELLESEEKLTAQVIGPGADREVLMNWIKEQVPKIKQRRQQLDAELKNLEYQRADILKKAGCEDIRETAKSFIRDFDNLTGVERRNILERFISKIVITADQKVVLHFRGEPLTHNVTRWKKSTDGEVNGGPCWT